MKLAGTIIEIQPVETGEGKNGQWKNQVFAIEYADGNFTKKCSFSVRSDKALEMLNKYGVGELVEVMFSPESYKKNDRWYPSNNAYKISHV